MIRWIRTRWRWYREIKRLQDDMFVLGLDSTLREMHGTPQYRNLNAEIDANNRKYFKMRHRAWWRKNRKKFR